MAQWDTSDNGEGGSGASGSDRHSIPLTPPRASLPTHPAVDVGRTSGGIASSGSSSSTGNSSSSSTHGTDGSSMEAGSSSDSSNHTNSQVGGNAGIAPPAAAGQSLEEVSARRSQHLASHPLASKPSVHASQGWGALSPAPNTSSLCAPPSRALSSPSPTATPPTPLTVHRVGGESGGPDSSSSSRGSSSALGSDQDYPTASLPAAGAPSPGAQQGSSELTSWCAAAVSALTAPDRPHLTPTEASMALWAMGRSRTRPPGPWLVSLLAHTRASLPRFSDQQAVGVVCGAVALRPLAAPHHRLQQQVHLWHIIWSLARRAPLHPTAVARLLGAVSRMGGECRQEIVWKLRLRMLQGLRAAGPLPTSGVSVSRGGLASGSMRRWAGGQTGGCDTSGGDAEDVGSLGNLSRRYGSSMDSLDETPDVQDGSDLADRPGRLEGGHARPPGTSSRGRDSARGGSGCGGGGGSSSSALDIVTSLCALVKLRHRLGVHALHATTTALACQVDGLDPRGLTHAMWALARQTRDQPRAQLGHVGALLDALLQRLAGRQLLSTSRISHIAALMWGVATLHGLGSRVRFPYAPRVTGLRGGNRLALGGRSSGGSTADGGHWLVGSTRRTDPVEDTVVMISHSRSGGDGSSSSSSSSSSSGSGVTHRPQPGSRVSLAGVGQPLQQQARLDRCTAWLADCSRLLQPHIASMDAKPLSLILRALAQARVQPGHTFVECAAARSLVLLPSCQRHHLVAIAWSLLVLQWSGDQAWLGSCQAQWERCSATSSSARESAVMRQVLARLRRRCQGSHFASLDLA
ncbi:MAG: hypothetical protein WDW38_010409 [Sanguina aurantia]